MTHQNKVCLVAALVASTVVLESSVTSFASDDSNSPTTTLARPVQAARLQRRLYVNASAGAGGNGLSWATAYSHLQQALDTALASRGFVPEIWVAAGTYVPTVPTVPNDMRTATFWLPGGVAVRGGFAGNEDPATFDINDRDFSANETILSGDLNGDDDSGGDNSENAYHVVTIGIDFEPVSSVTLDGFTISGGNADLTGGGLVVNREVSDVEILQCTFRDNHASDRGGAIDSYGRDPVIRRCVFINNFSGGDGGAMFFSYHAEIHDCTCAQNSAASRGGAVFVNDTHVTINRTTFKENTAPRGGAIFLFDGVVSSLINCIVSSNVANDGAGIYGATTFVDMFSCVLVDNSAARFGGAISWYDSDFLISGATISGNSADVGGAIYGEDAGSYDDPSFLSNSILWGDIAMSGGQEIALGVDPPDSGDSLSVSYCDIQGGLAGVVVAPEWVLRWSRTDLDVPPEFIDAMNGDLHLQTASPCIDSGDNASAALFVDTTSASGTTTSIVVTDPDRYAVGDEIEYDGDSVLRTVTSIDVGLGVVSFSDAPLLQPAEPGKPIANYGWGDIDGNDRIIGGVVDMGAYEAP